MMRLDDFILLLAKKYGRQNENMHDDFNVIIAEMKKNLNLFVRRSSKYMSTMSTNSSRDRDFINVPPPNASVRSYEDLSDI